MLEARGLCKSYGGRAVVADLSLTVGAGEIVGLLGPNGAGKSTTVAMLCGLVGADRGAVFVGSDASRLALDENAHTAKRRIGVVPQELSIYENLGAATNLELFGALYGMAGALLRERVAAALALVGLADRAGEPVEGAEQLQVRGRAEVLVDRELLRHDADAALGRVRVFVEGQARRTGADDDLAAVRADQAAQHRHGRRLAGAVRPEQADDLARADVERQVGDDGTVAIRLEETSGFEHGSSW